MGATQEHLNLGLALVLSKRWEEARAEFEAAARADPGDAEAQFQWGKACQTLGQHAQAEHAFRRCVELDPARVEARARLGGVLIQLGRREDARAVLREALIRAPENVTALNAFGDLEMAAGAWGEAVRSWEHSLRLQEAQAETAFKLAYAYESLGRLQDAAVFYQAALRVSPRRLPVLLALASALERLGRPAEAVATLAEAASQRPGDAALALRLARALNSCDAGAAVGVAVETLRGVPPQDPGYAEVRCRLGSLLARQGDSAGAAQVFQDAARSETPPWNDYAAGWLAQHAGRAGEALDLYRRAALTGEGGAGAMAWESLAALLYRRSELDGALEAYTKLSEIQPRNVEAFLRLGSLNLKAGRRDAAREAWERALSVDPGNTLARKNLAVLKG